MCDVKDSDHEERNVIKKSNLEIVRINTQVNPLDRKNSEIRIWAQNKDAFIRSLTIGGVSRSKKI